jgi:hypothetical protein
LLDGKIGCSACVIRAERCSAKFAFASRFVFEASSRVAPGLRSMARDADERGFAQVVALLEDRLTHARLRRQTA